MIAATHGLAEHEHGLGSGLLNTSQELGSALGLSALAAIAAVATVDALVGAIENGFIVAACLVGVAVLAASRLPAEIGRTSAESAMTTGV